MSEREDYAELEPLQPSDAGWRWETIGSLVCIPLYVAWLWVTDGHRGYCGPVLIALLLGNGIGLAVSGCRRGVVESRWAARLALAVHLLVAIVIVGYALRGWLFDEW